MQIAQAMINPYLLPLAKHIYEIEGITLELSHLYNSAKPIYVNPTDYDYVRAASNNYSIRRWLEVRFEKKVKGVKASVIDRYGKRLDKNLVLKEVRTRCDWNIIYFETFNFTYANKSKEILNKIRKILLDINISTDIIEKDFLWWKWWVIEGKLRHVVMYEDEFVPIQEKLEQLAANFSTDFDYDWSSADLLEKEIILNNDYYSEDKKQKLLNLNYVLFN